jgi:Alginate export
MDLSLHPFARHLLLYVALCMGIAMNGAPSLAQNVNAPGPLRLPNSSPDFVLLDIAYELKGSTGDPRRDQTILAEARMRSGFGPGDRYNQILADGSALRMRRIEGVRNATYSLQQRINPDGITLVFHLDITRSAIAPDQTGIAQSGRIRDLPLIFQNERGLLTFTLNGGSGLFRDGQAWFGAPGVFTRNNPLVSHPARGAGTGAVSAWTENYVEYGLGGSVQLGDTPFYAYGAASMMAIAEIGQDIYRGDTRTSNTLEKLYAGLLYAGPTGTNATLSIGRQNFTLNDGFLISQYGSQWNAGPRPGIYLAPRTTQDFSVLGQWNWQNWTLRGFLLNPNEYEPIESNTILGGANLRYQWSPSFYADVSIISVVNSDSSYLLPNSIRYRREGTFTLAGHVRWADANVIDGLWVEAEGAHQTHPDFAMDAWAGYGTLGYLASNLPWTPSLSYRLAYFSGDNPATPTYERFDSLYSGGLAEWLQGISFAKILTQSNKVSDRIRLNFVPQTNLNVSFDWFRHRADAYNNLGANPAIIQLSSHDLGQEFQMIGRWSINRHFFFQAVAGYAIPGEALKQAAGQSLKPWTTLQAQLFWTL